LCPYAFRTRLRRPSASLTQKKQKLPSLDKEGIQGWFENEQKTKLTIPSSPKIGGELCTFALRERCGGPPQAGAERGNAERSTKRIAHPGASATRALSEVEMRGARPLLYFNFK